MLGALAAHRDLLRAAGRVVINFQLAALGPLAGGREGYGERAVRPAVQRGVGAASIRHEFGIGRRDGPDLERHPAVIGQRHRQRIARRPARLFAERQLLGRPLQHACSHPQRHH